MIASSTNNCEEFIQIYPFNAENVLDPRVVSDHAEIALQTPEGRVMNAWNISNPTYHSNFKYGPKPPFLHSHLFVEKPYVDGKMIPSLAAKIDGQLTTIVERFGKVGVQVIVEGYAPFFTELARRLSGRQFQMVSLLDQLTEKWEDQWNVTGILVDTAQFDVVDRGVVQTTYKEEAEPARDRFFYLPHVQLLDKKSQRRLIVAGVHVPGLATDHPKRGLEILANTLDELWKKAQGAADVIAMGDFNAPTAYVRASLIEKLQQKGHLLTAPYRTHVNPKSQAANYDHAVVIASNGPYTVLSRSEISTASNALIYSIEQSRALSIHSKI